MNPQEAFAKTLPDTPENLIAYAKTIPPTGPDNNRLADPGGPALLDMLLQTPIDTLLADARRKQEELIEKKTKLNLVIDLIIKKLPHLNPIAIEKLRKLQETRDTELLYKGFQAMGLPGYLFESANGDPENERRALRVYDHIHTLVYEINKLEKNILPNFHSAIEIRQLRATPPPLPPAKKMPVALPPQKNGASGARPIAARAPNRPEIRRAA